MTNELKLLIKNGYQLTRTFYSSTETDEVAENMSTLVMFTENPLGMATSDNLNGLA